MEITPFMVVTRIFQFTGCLIPSKDLTPREFDDVSKSMMMFELGVIRLDQFEKVIVTKAQGILERNGIIDYIIQDGDLSQHKQIFNISKN